MHIVKIMGINQLYFTPEETAPDTIEIDGIVWRVQPNIDSLPPNLFDHESMRKVCLRRLPPKDGVGTAIIFYLYWMEERDLGELDQRVELSQTTDEDFDLVLFTHYHPRLICLDGCKSTWLALIAEMGGVSRPGGRYMKKLGKLEWERCPECGTRFRIPVARILGSGPPLHG